VALLAAGALLNGCGGSSGSAIGGFADDPSGIAAPPVGQLDPGDTLQPQFASASGGKPHYKIGPTDVLTVTVFQVNDLNRDVQVAGNGSITLPLIGMVPASGRTSQEVEAQIASRLGARYLQHPQVTVFIKEYNSQKITVGGSVKKPGVMPLKGDMTLLQAVASAEGLDTVADASNVVIFREQDGRRYVGKFDINQVRSGAARDPLLQNGDIVMVDSSSTKTALRDWAPLLSGFGSTAAFISVLK
jgi:polysaccharide biosynthesis/export protein